jgi:hypothetical protein
MLNSGSGRFAIKLPAFSDVGNAHEAAGRRGHSDWLVMAGCTHPVVCLKAAARGPSWRLCAADLPSARFQSAPKSPMRHRPQFQGTERCFSVWYGQAEVGRPSGSFFVGSSMSPWSVACCACHRLSNRVR